MDAIEAIKTRYSVRFFKLDPVSDEQVRAHLEAAVAAQTAMKAEQWFFSVIKGEERKRCGRSSRRLTGSITRR